MTPAGEHERGLHQLADFPVGTVINLRKFHDLERYRDIVLREFNSITSEITFKASYIHPAQGKFVWEEADELCRFCAGNNMRLHGHTLIWGQQLPQWIIDYQGSRADWIDLMQHHIVTIVQHYKGRVQAWDVVNEAFYDDGALQANIWQKNIGDDYIEYAFRYAREADPAALLFCNEFSLEYNQHKRKAVIDMITTLRDRGVKVDGVGMQMHGDIFCKNELRLSDAFSEFAAEGLLIHLSEVDIAVNPHDQQIDSYEAFLGIQADIYEFIFSEYLRIPPHLRHGITFWGVGDSDSWIRQLLMRIDHPLLFDDEYQPKPALIKVRNLLRSAGNI